MTEPIPPLPPAMQTFLRSRMDHLIRIAAHDLDAVDNFDLRSDDPASVAKFATFQADARDAQLNLMDFIAANYERLCEIFDG